MPQFPGSIKLNFGAEKYCRFQNSISAENLGERFHLFITRKKRWKVKVCLVRALKAYRGSTGIAPLILNLKVGG